MGNYKKRAIAIGVLFLIALILNPVATEILDPIINKENFLILAYPNSGAIIIASLLNFSCAIAMIFIPLVFFPLAKKQNENLAVCYSVFRGLEGILFIYMAIKMLSFVSLSKAYLAAEVPTASTIQAIGNSIKNEIDWATNIYIIIFTMGGFSFYSLLYKSRLIPRFLSTWGLAGVFVLLVGAMMALFGIWVFSYMPLMKGMVYFAPLIALNELVLAIWLITKGFNAPVESSVVKN